MALVADWLTAVQRICVLTGAGISTDSGTSRRRWDDVAGLVVRELIGIALPGLLAAG